MFILDANLQGYKSLLYLCPGCSYWLTLTVSIGGPYPSIYSECSDWPTCSDCSYWLTCTHLYLFLLFKLTLSNRFKLGLKVLICITKFLNCQIELMLTSCQLFCFCEHFLAAQLKLFFLALYFFDCI